MRQNGWVGIQLVTAWAQILIGGRTNTEPSLHANAHFSRKYELTGKGGGRGEGVGNEGGLSPYFNSSLKRVLAAKHLPCSSATPIHITPVLLHP